MSIKISKVQYQMLIEDDLHEISKYMPDTVERHHIEHILNESVNVYYPQNSELEEATKLTANNKLSMLLNSPCKYCGDKKKCDYVGSDPCPRR